MRLEDGTNADISFMNADNDTEERCVLRLLSKSPPGYPRFSERPIIRGVPFLILCNRNLDNTAWV